jgi:hypothetical protein
MQTTKKLAGVGAIKWLKMVLTVFCSRERNYTSEDSGVAGSEKKLCLYYCAFCGAYALVLDMPLEALPTRKADSAWIVSKTTTFKHQMESGQVKLIRRFAAKVLRVFCIISNVFLICTEQVLWKGNLG